MLHRLRSERGETYIELIVSTALLGILGVAMIVALSSTIIVSNADRGYAGTETVLRSYATQLERSVYKPCTAGSSTNPYSPSDLNFTGPSAGYTTSVTAVKFLADKNAPNITAASAFSTTCQTLANGGDQGVQQLTLKASRNDGSVSQTFNVLLRRGDS